LNKIAKAVGRYAWAALYQQRPKPREGGIFKWEDIDGHRVKEAPDLMRVGVALDPSGSSGGDEVGIVVAGIARDGHAYVLKDASLHASPNQWASVCSMVYNKYMADFLVGEKNYGGDMVEATVKTVNNKINYMAVVASRGKELRAEPVSALYEQGLVHHVGEFAQMEDEMTTWKPGADSPNRMDALVFVLTELMLNDEEDITVTSRNWLGFDGRDKSKKKYGMRRGWDRWQAPARDDYRNGTNAAY
jgi:phage terminase large subunit-like protein